MNNLIIIGNGFDLAHGLKTSYNDFIEYLINKTIKENTFRSLIVESYNIKRVEDLKEQIKLQNITKNQFRNKFIGALISDISLKNWCDIEAKYFDILSTVYGSPDLYRSYSTLNKDFLFLREKLSEYLITQNSSAQQLKAYNYFFNAMNLPTTRILNFNYTNTFKRLYDLKQPNGSKTIQIHGEVENINNPIVFGYAATYNQSRLLINNIDVNNENMRFIKKNLYKRAENEYLLAEYLNKTKKIDITILGHSCGISDHLILNQIFNHENTNSIRFLYYENPKEDPKGEEHFFQTQINIDRIIEEDDKFNKLLIDYNRSTRMPQYNDTSDQTEEFIRKIKELRSEQERRRPKFAGAYLP